jgi:hypothetical protein
MTKRRLLERYPPECKLFDPEPRRNGLHSCLPRHQGQSSEGLPKMWFLRCSRKAALITLPIRPQPDGDCSAYVSHLPARFRLR